VWTTLGEVTDNLDSQRKPVSAAIRATRTGDIPYYGATGQVGTIDKALFDEELVLLGEDGVQFFNPRKSKAYLIRGKSWVNNHAHVLRARPMTSNRFLVHYLNIFNYTGFANGTTRLKLTKSAACSIPIPLPPLAEQHRIVEALEDHLSRLDAAEAELASIDRRLCSLTDALLVEAVRLVPGSALPAGWDWRSLESLSSGSSYGTSTKCDSEGRGTAVVRIPNIRDGVLELNDMKYALNVDADLTNLHLKAGDILFVRTNGSPSLIGRTAVVRHDMPIAFASYLIRFHLGNAEIADWVHLVLSSPRWREEIVSAAASSAGQYNVNQTFLKRLQIPFPSVDTRAEILLEHSENRNEVNRLRQAVRTAQSRADALRRSLLRAAFNGELVDQDPNDESADVARDRQRNEAKSTPMHGSRRAVPVSAED